MTKKLNDALRKQKKNTKEKPLLITGSLGIPLGGQVLVEVPNRNAFVYVKLRDNHSEVIQAFNNKVAPVYNLPVIVERVNNRYEVIGVDAARYQSNWSSFAPYLPRHGNTHSFNIEGGGGGDIVWVYPRQFMPSLILPSGSSGGPNVVMTSYILKNADGTWKYTGLTGTSDITVHKPTGTSAVMVLVYLDSQSGNPYFLVGSGSYFSESITGSSEVYQYIPSSPNTSHIPLAAVRLVSGTNIISWDNIYDVRQFIHTTPTGTGGSNIAIQDEGVAKGSVTTLNFVGDNVQATVSGNTARIFVTGSAGGGSINTGTLDARYLKLDASNDPLTGELDITSPTYGASITSSDGYSPLYLNQDANGISTDPVIYAERYSTGSSGQFVEAAYHIRDDIKSAQFKGGSLRHIFYSGSVPYRPQTISEINPYAHATTGTPFYINAQNPISATGTFLLFERQGTEIFRVNGSGTALSNGVPLIKEAPADGQPYGRQNNGWVLLLTGTVAGGGGGGGGVGIMGWDEGVPLGTGTVLNVVGAGASLTLSGTVLNLNVPGGGNGLVFQDSGVPLGTGTILNFVGDELYASVSGSVAQLTLSGTYNDGRYLGAYNYAGANYRIGLAKSPNLRNWKIVKEPILDLGAGGTWDDEELRHPNLVEVNGVLYLYYEGYDGSQWKIGLARSFDSSETWDKYSGNPILSGSAGWETTGSTAVSRAMVFYDEDDPNPNSRWKMWYAGGQDGSGGLGYAYSSDGLSWTKYGGNPVLSLGTAGQWDDTYVDTGGIIKRNDGLWLLFYGGKHGNLWKSGLVTFTNPTGTYTRAPGNPLLSGDGITTSITSNVSVGDVRISVDNANLFPVGAVVWVYDNSQRYLTNVRKIVSSTVLEVTNPAPDAIASASGNVETVTSGSVEVVGAAYDDAFIFSVTAFQPLSAPSTVLEATVLGYAKDTLDEIKIDYSAGLSVPISLEESRAATLSKENLSFIDTWGISKRRTPVPTGTSGGGTTNITNNNVSIAVQDDGAFLASGTVLSFDNNLLLGVSGTVIHISSPVTTYQRFERPVPTTSVTGTLWRVPDNVYASGSLGVFYNGLTLYKNADYEELIYVSGTYQLLFTPSTGSTHMVSYGVPCIPQVYSTGTVVSSFALQDSDSELLTDSDDVQLLDSDG